MNTGIVIGAAASGSADVSAVYQWGLTVVKFIQTWDNPAVDTFMRDVSVFGAEAGYLALLPLIFWCIDEKKGVRIGVILLFSTWINASLKILFHQPRPFQLDPSVGKSFEPTYGIPSGHAQSSFVFWTVIASWTKRTWVFVLAILLSFVMGVSRLYLGVHFPTDLFAGWLLGGVILVCYILFEKRISDFLAKSGLRVQLVVSATVSFAAILTGNILLGGAILGMGAGYALMLKFARFTAKPKRERRLFTVLLRYIVGVAGVAVLNFVFRNLTPDKGSAYYPLIYFCLPVSLGLWVYAGAPWVFIKLRLAERRQEFTR
ncbi:MAG: phosphatase PAP2 family protein [Treponema sp.]|nr:phosphatase PAP2 family protein [Treponema sp.]